MSEVKRYDISAFGGMSMDECRDGAYVNYDDYSVLEAKCEALAAENARLKSAVTQQIELRAEIKKAGRPPHADFWVQSICEAEEKVKRALEETQATDAFLAEVKAEARKEGAYFVSNRMLAAWIAGFIDDTAKNAADIARMIITSTEFMDDAPDGDFDRSFSDSVLEDIINQLRKGVDQK